MKKKKESLYTLERQSYVGQYKGANAQKRKYAKEEQFLSINGGCHPLRSYAAVSCCTATPSRATPAPGQLSRGVSPSILHLHTAVLVEPVYASAYSSFLSVPPR